jgi:hypothetical protein
MKDLTVAALALTVLGTMFLATVKEWLHRTGACQGRRIYFVGRARAGHLDGAAGVDGFCTSNFGQSPTSRSPLEISIH